MLHYPFNARSFERERHEHESSRYVTAPGGGARNREAAGRAHLLYLGEDTDAEAVERDDRPISPNSGVTFPPICDIFAIRGNMYNIFSISSNIFPIFV